MSDIIKKNDAPEPSEASQVAAFGGEATEAAAVEVPAYMPRPTLGQLLRGDLGFGLPAIAVLLYASSLIVSYVRRKRAGLRTMSFLQLVLRIALTVLLVGGAVAIFESYHGVPYSAAILFGLIALFWLIMTKTSFGRHVYAVGGSAEAARRAGINVVV